MSRKQDPKRRRNGRRARHAGCLAPRRLAVALTLGLTVLLAAATITATPLTATAAAATTATQYWVGACDGTNDASGWSASFQNPDRSSLPAGISCGNGVNSMAAYADSGTTDPDFSLLTFDAPAGLSISSFLPVDGHYYSSWPGAVARTDACQDGESVCPTYSGYEAGIYAGSIDPGDDTAASMLLDAESDTTTPNTPISTGAVGQVGFGVWCAPSYSSLVWSGWGDWNGCITGTQPDGTDATDVGDGAYMQGADVQLTDSLSQPASQGMSWSSGISSPGAWYDTDASTDPTLSLGATDPAGVCVLGASLTGGGGNTLYSPNLVSPPDHFVSTASETTFASAQPCATGAVTGSYALPTGLASGAYMLSMLAASPADYAAGDTSVSASPNIAADFLSIHVDDATPTLTWPDASTNGYVAGPATLQIVAGPSGIGSVSCKDGGVAVTATQLSGAADGAGTTTWSVPVSEGGSASCSAVNGDINAQLTGTSPTVTGATPPQVALAGTSDTAWLTSESATVGISAETDGSGLAGIVCSIDGGPAQPVTLTTSTGSADTGSGTITVTGDGRHSVSCTATTGAGLTSAATGEVLIDTAAPALSLSDPGYTQDQWVSSPQTVTVDSADSLSGTAEVDCGLDAVAPTRIATTPASATVTAGTVAISGSGQTTLTCHGLGDNGLQGPDSTYTVDIDPQQPTVSFSGAAAAPAILSGTPPVVVTGTEPQMLSGVTQIDCTVNGTAIAPLTVDAADGYTGSFALAQNGADRIACHALSGAGVTGPDAAETVDVDNPNNAGSSGDAGQPSGTNAGASLTRYGSSSSVDDGNDPWSGLPAPGWHTTTQSATVTAVNTAGSAPITSITCSGATLAGGDSYPRTAANAYGGGGERITLAIQSPGGNVSCVAQDSAGNSYALGSQEFEVDATRPTGEFRPRSQWPEPDAVQVQVADGALGSGVTSVTLTASAAGVPTVSLPARLVSGNRTTGGVWEARIDDGTMALARYTFAATASDVAGNQRTLTTTRAGAAETLKLPLRDLTVLSDTLSAGQADSAGQQDQTMPAVLSGEAGPAAVTERPLRIGPQGRIAVASARKSSNQPLRLAYGRAAIVSGTLTDASDHDSPVAHATVLIYAVAAGTDGKRLIGRARTDASGRYRHRIVGGPSRTVYVVYAGTQRLRSAVGQDDEQVTGRVRLTASSHLGAGGAVTFRGRVYGGYIPRGGVLVTLQDEVKGLMAKFGSFGAAPIRTDSAGRFRATLAVPRLAHGYTYRFRAVVAAQSGWPFRTAIGAALTRTVD